MPIVILGVDPGKNACSVMGVDAAGAVVVRRSMRRQALIDYVAKLPACVVAIGGMLRRSSSATPVCLARTRDPADAA